MPGCAASTSASHQPPSRFSSACFAPATSTPILAALGAHTRKRCIRMNSLRSESTGQPGSGPPSWLCVAVMMVRPMMRLLHALQIEGRVDQCDVREGLREVSDQAFPLDVVFLREQAEIVAQSQQPLEERPRVLEAADRLERAHHPEA